MGHYPFYGNPAVYVDMDIVSFDAVPALAEMGSSVPSVILRWKLSKKPLTFAINNVAYPTNTLQLPTAGPFTTEQSWSIKVSDAEIEVSAKTQLQFANKSHWGFVTSPPASSADILAIANSKFAIPDYELKATIGAPVGLVFCYAYPARLGMPRLVNLFTPSGIWQPTTHNTTYTDFTTTTVSFTNGSGFTEDYFVHTFNTALPYDSTVVQFLTTSKAPYTNNVDWDETSIGGWVPPGQPLPLSDSLWSDE